MQECVLLLCLGGLAWLVCLCAGYVSPRFVLAGNRLYCLGGFVWHVSLCVGYVSPLFVSAGNRRMSLERSLTCHVLSGLLWPRNVLALCAAEAVRTCTALYGSL